MICFQIAKWFGVDILKRKIMKLTIEGLVSEGVVEPFMPHETEQPAYLHRCRYVKPFKGDLMLKTQAWRFKNGATMSRFDGSNQLAGYRIDGVGCITTSLARVCLAAGYDPSHGWLVRDFRPDPKELAILAAQREILEKALTPEDRLMETIMGKRAILSEKNSDLLALAPFLARFDPKLSCLGIDSGLVRILEFVLDLRTARDVLSLSSKYLAHRLRKFTEETSILEPNDPLLDRAAELNSFLDSAPESGLVSMINSEVLLKASAKAAAT
ncbi:MAG: hypothetical protein K0S20_84 [Patescibacteria group bacterium]|jgi:hypothetical protein|nr:hypothetical protein [Patescibacteria group bacterium]